MASIHSNEVIFTESSLKAFIGKIHNNIKDNYHFVSTSDMAEKLAANSGYDFKGYELEITQAFPTNNTTYGWNKEYIAKICIINNEIHYI